VASVPDATAVLPIFVVAAAACSVLPAVDTAAALSVLSTRVTTPLTLALGCVGLPDADDGSTVVDAAGAAGVTPSIASESVVTSEASRSSGAGVVIDVAGGRADGGAPAAVLHVGCVATKEGGEVAVDVDGGAAAAATAALAWTDDDPVFSPDPSAGTTPAMASASASQTAGAPPAAVALGGDTGTRSRVWGGGAPWGGSASSVYAGARGISPRGGRRTTVVTPTADGERDPLTASPSRASPPRADSPPPVLLAKAAAAAVWPITERELTV